MEPKKKEFALGEGSEVEVPETDETEVVPTEETPPEPEEGSGDYVVEEGEAESEAADDSYAQHRSENRGE